MRENSYNISEPSIQRALTNGTMKIYSHNVLSMQRIYLGEKNTEMERITYIGRM